METKNLTLATLMNLDLICKGRILVAERQWGRLCNARASANTAGRTRGDWMDGDWVVVVLVVLMVVVVMSTIKIMDVVIIGDGEVTRLWFSYKFTDTKHQFTTNDDQAI